MIVKQQKTKKAKQYLYRILIVSIVVFMMILSVLQF